MGICVGTGAPEPSSAGARGLSQQPVVPSALSGFSLSAEPQNNEYISHMHKQRQTTPPLLFFPSWPIFALLLDSKAAFFSVIDP